MKTSLHIAVMGFALGVFVTTALCPAQTAPADPTQQELLNEVRALRAEVKDLKSELNAQHPATQPAGQATAQATSHSAPSDPVPYPPLPPKPPPPHPFLKPL